jgi:hypothetical protein
MVEIISNGNKAWVSGGEWLSENLVLQELCEMYSERQPWQPQPSDPSPDYTVAVYVAEKLGAKIVRFDIPESVPGRVY